MNKIMLACVAAAMFVSCADKEPDHDSSLAVPDSTRPATVNVPESAAIQRPADNNVPATLQPASMVQPGAMVQPVVNQPVTATAPGMNPPHGQPGHRCDIAVGAPLNSAPSKPATVTTTATTTPAKTVTAPGMNPPHGEPGHRCDIAVGAPLNSKPATQTAPAVTPAAPAMTPVNPAVTPAKVDSGG